MIGDAPGDFQRLQENSCVVYPILAGKKRILGIRFSRMKYFLFLLEEHDENFQKNLENFKNNLNM